MAELINAIMLNEHPHFRNVVRDAVPLVAVKLADLQGDQTLQHIEAFLRQARDAPQGTSASFDLLVHIFVLACLQVH